KDTHARTLDKVYTGCLTSVQTLYNVQKGPAMRRLITIAFAAALVLGIAGPASARSGLTIVDTAVAVNAQSGEFDHLIEAVVRADLVGTLDGHRQFTVFAPTDAAFEALFSALG